MNNVWYYITQDYALYSVTLPWAFILYWLATEARTNPPSQIVMFHWALCVIATYLMSWWVITPDTIGLYMVDVFCIYLTFYLWLGLKITPSTAYALTYISIWIPDMVRAKELVSTGLADADTYFFGVGGAGLGDGLCIVPIIAAALVHYVTWRRK